MADDEESTPASFSSLRSRFEAMAAGASPKPSSDGRIAPVPERARPYGGNQVAARSSDSARSVESNARALPIQAQQAPSLLSPPSDVSSAPTEREAAPSAWSPPHLQAAHDRQPLPPVPRRTLSPSLSVPSLRARYPGAAEALAYAESTSAQPATASQSPSPPPPPVPERPRATLLATSAPATHTIKSTQGTPSPHPSVAATSTPSSTLHEKPLPQAGFSLDDDIAYRYRAQDGGADALRTLSSASHRLMQQASSLVRHPSQAHGLQDDRSNKSTPTDANSSSSGTPPNGKQAILPPPRRGPLQPKAIPSNVNVPSHGESQHATENEDEDSSESDEMESQMNGVAAEEAAAARVYEELPDASRANRRPPHHSPPRTISTKGHTGCLAVHSDLLVLGHHDKLRTYRAKDSWEPRWHNLSIGHERREIKLSTLAFRPTASDNVRGSSTANGVTRSDGRHLWCGTKEGDLLEFDIEESRFTSHRTNAHTAPVILLELVGRNMISVDESGKICTWISKNVDGSEHAMVTLNEPPITQRIVMDRFSCAIMVGEELWVSSAGEGAAARTPKMRVFRPFCIDKPFNAVSRPVTIPDALGGGQLGLISSGAVLPLQPEYVYLGHQSGHISVWNRSTYSCIRVQPLHISGVTTLCGVRGYHLWAGSRRGEIRIFDVRERPWVVVKSWEAHKGAAITNLIADPASIEQGKLQVLSSSLEGDIHLWDGLLTSDWLTLELERRLTEYSSFRILKSLHITFNIDAAAAADFGDRELPGLDLLDKGKDSTPDIIIIGFQEMVDLQDTRVMAKSLLMGGGRRNKGGADVGERLSHQARAWTQKIKTEVQRKMAQVDGKTGYRLVLQDSLVGLYSAIFVRESEMINVRDPAIASIKTGFGGRMGNKGAIVASMRIDDTPMAWVNCHLAAGQRHVRQRNADLVNIFECTPFTDRAVRSVSCKEFDAFAGGGDGAMILPDHEIVFLSGDLNYRIDLRRDQCLDLIHKGNWQALLARDQLHRQLRENPAHRLRPFHEAPIQFAPTYKFDRQTSTYDTSEKQRVPAYCDRILWYARSERAHAIECMDYVCNPHIIASDHRPVIARFSFQTRKTNAKQRQAILDELHDAWKVAQAERLRAAREFYFGA